jgi:hypothetical protein
MITVRILYSSGVVSTYTGFKTKEDAAWFIHNEGDHVVWSEVEGGE